MESFQKGTEKVLVDPNYVFVAWEGKPAMEAAESCILQKIICYEGPLVFYTRKKYPYFEIINYQ